MDRNNIAGYLEPSNQIPNTNSTRAYLIEQIQEWNGDSYFAQGSLIGNIVLGDVNSIPEIKNGINEISFTFWSDDDFEDPMVVGANNSYSTRDTTVQTPFSDRTATITESDIFMNPISRIFLGKNIPSDCTQSNLHWRWSLDTVLKHELGHALGRPHYSSGKLMRATISACTYYDITPALLDGMTILYPSRETIDINIQSPTENQVLIINQQNIFTANITSLFGKKMSLEQIKAIEDDLVWTSSIDGVLGVGNNIDPNLLTGGEHELTVTVGQPGDATYGESYSTYFVIDTTSDLVDGYGRTIAYPFPCVRTVDRSDGACLFTVLESVNTTPIDVFGCITSATGYTILDAGNQNPHSYDYEPNGQSVTFDLHSETVPRCGGVNTGRKYFAHSSWVIDSINENKVDFRLFSSLSDIVGDIVRDSHFDFYDMPIVEPEIFVDTPSDCNVENVTAKCGVNISWDGNYFLPDAGIFYKANGTSNWALAKMISDVPDGSVNTGNIIGVDGGQLAVFQYSHDVRTPKDNVRMIAAPSGLMAGPFSVKAISSNTTPTDPTLVSAETSCSNNYCIDLRGHNFGTDSYVDIQADLGGNGVLKRIEGNDIYDRSPVGGFDRIFFPIQDIALQDKLSSTGLCFWVVNPPEFSDPICITRPTTPPQQPFMGKTVESYKKTGKGIQDIEHTSYEVNGGNGNELVIWGNSWKKIAMNYSVTANTVLEFSFKSTQQQAEIVGIGFISEGSNSVGSTKAWQVYGTQIWANQEFHSYTGSDWTTYEIPIGENFTGNISHMVFIADEDAHVGQHVSFKDPILNELITPPDQYEEDDVSTASKNYTGQPQDHNFVDDTVDWVQLWVPQAGTVEYFTSELEANADTCLDIYKTTNLVTPVASNCDFNGAVASRIELTVVTATMYKVKITNQNNITGINTGYKITIGYIN